MNQSSSEWPSGRRQSGKANKTSTYDQRPQKEKNKQRHHGHTNRSYDRSRQKRAMPRKGEELREQTLTQDFSVLQKRNFISILQTDRTRKQTSYSIEKKTKQHERDDASFSPSRKRNLISAPLAPFPKPQPTESHPTPPRPCTPTSTDSPLSSVQTTTNRTKKGRKEHRCQRCQNALPQRKTLHNRWAQQMILSPLFPPRFPSSSFSFPETFIRAHRALSRKPSLPAKPNKTQLPF